MAGDLKTNLTFGGWCGGDGPLAEYMVAVTQEYLPGEGAEPNALPVMREIDLTPFSPYLSGRRGMLTHWSTYDGPIPSQRWHVSSGFWGCVANPVRAFQNWRAASAERRRAMAMPGIRHRTLWFDLTDGGGDSGTN